MDHNLIKWVTIVASAMLMQSSARGLLTSLGQQGLSRVGPDLGGVCMAHSAGANSFLGGLR